MNSFFPSAHIPKISVSDGDNVTNLAEFIQKNSKLSIFVFVPFFAIAGSIIFYRLRLNFVEHNIQSVVSIIAAYFVYMFTDFLSDSLVHTLGLAADSLLVSIISDLSIVYLLYPLYGYYVFSARGGYSIGGRIWRLLALYLMVFALLLLFYAGVYFYMSRGV